MEKLIEKSLSGDENAYAELIELVKYDLYNIAKSRLRNYDDIEDAFQETIIKSYQNLHTLKHKKYFKTWIVRILINECNNINKSYNKSTNLFNKIVDKNDFSTFTDTTSNIDNSMFMDELLNKLDDDEKEIANLYFKNNFSSDKIAELLHANKNTVKSRIYRIRQKLKQLAILLIVLCIITTTTVFAEDIIEFIISLFTTSRQAIDTAVENDYVQNVDMDFVYDNDIGIKVDYLLIDDKNLSVSYVFDCTSDKDITSVELLDYTITDENGNKIFSNNLESITNASDNFGKQVEIDEKIFRDSTIYSSLSNFPISTNFTFRIDLLSIHKNDNVEKINGHWNFTINLEDKFVNRNSETYSATYSEFITDISTTVDKTSLIIKLNLNVPIDESKVKNLIMSKEYLFLKNEFNYQYNLLSFKFENTDDNLGYIELKYDISQYFENINNLHLYIDIDTDKIIDINLIK